MKSKDAIGWFETNYHDSEINLTNQKVRTFVLHIKDLEHKLSLDFN